MKSLTKYLKLSSIEQSQRGMPVLLMSGKEVSEKIRSQLSQKAKEFEARSGRPPRLDVILVGEDKASQVYVKNKHKACEKIGMKSVVHNLPTETREDELLKKIRELNESAEVDGILVQMPVPKQISSQNVLDCIAPEKDADGLTPYSAGLLWSGKEGVRPCTPQGVMHILAHYQIPVAGRKAVVVGRSQIVGKPMAALLLAADATVTICHSRSQDLEVITRDADIVVVAAGKPRFLGKSAFKKGSVVIDVGIHGSGQGKICGDVRTEELDGWVKAVTPVPGGVGPMTITCLLENTIWLAENNFKKK